MRTAFQSTPSDGPPARLLAVMACAVRSDAVVITVRGEVDLNTGPLLSDRLHRLIHRSGPDLIVDLTGVRFFGAAGVAVLVDVRSAAVTAEVGFRVVADTRVVLLPLSITGTDCLFDVFPDLLQAMVPSRPVHLAGGGRSVGRM